MQWLLKRRVFLWLEEHYQKTHGWVKLNLFTFLTQVCISSCHFICSSFKPEYTEHLDYPEPDSGAVNASEKVNQLAWKSSVGSPTERQPQQPSRSSSDKPELVPPDVPSGKKARLEDGRLTQFERQLLETLVTKTERDRGIAQLIDELAQLTSKLALKSALLEQAEANTGEEKKHAKVELRELQAKLDESLMSRDHALEQAQSALQKASCAAEANEQSQRELAEMRAELEESKSESAAFRLRLADTENGCAKSKAEANTYRTQTATGLFNTDEDRIMHRLMERMQVMETEIASLRWNEKSFEMMECRNEGMKYVF
jgi:hypothetical protein